MIDFSLQHIMQKSPYDITLSKDDFIFETDNGILYRVSFEEESIVLGGCKTYQFILQNVEHTHAPHDRFTICTANAQVEDEIVYVAIIVDNRNPQLQAITDDFKAAAEILTNKPADTEV